MAVRACLEGSDDDGSGDIDGDGSGEGAGDGAATDEKVTSGDAAVPDLKVRLVGVTG